MKRQIDEFIKLTAKETNQKESDVRSIITHFFKCIERQVVNQITPYFSLPTFGSLRHKFYKKPFGDKYKEDTE
jgi:nucleoid DNA-binding protein